MDNLASQKDKSVQEITSLIILFFAKEMKHRRCELGLTNASLSAKSYVSKTTISNLERGTLKNISIYALVQLSKALEYYDIIEILTVKANEKTK